MKVRILGMVEGVVLPHPGEVIDLPDDAARVLIERDFAAEVVEPEPAKPPVKGKKD